MVGLPIDAFLDEYRQRTGQDVVGSETISGMAGIDQFFLHVRGALNHLYDPEYLARSPLLSLLAVNARYEPALALQEVLIKAIELMRPRARDLLAARDQQVFDLLLYRYVQRLTQEEIANQLGVSERQLRRDQNGAIRVVADRLWKQYNLEERSQLLDTPAPQGSEPETGDEFFAWLAQEGRNALTDPNQALVTVIELAEQLAGRCETRLTWSAPAGLPPLAMHPVAFRQILVMLLAYAVQAAAGCTAALHVSTEGRQINFEITAGPAVGVEPPQNGGIGQALELIKLCKGDLRVSHEPAAVRLSLSLPIFEQQTVLLIDDNADFAQLLQRYAAGTRYRVVAVQDAGRALQSLEAALPRIILLDVMMPRVDGWEMLKRLRGHPLAAHHAIVICTILNQAELAFALGANAFLRKPVTQADFLATLDRLAGAPATAPG